MSFSDTSSSPDPFSATCVDSLSEDEAYAQLLAVMQSHFMAAVGDSSEKVSLFTADVPDLFDIFLSHIPVERRQSYTCSVCRKFVEKYGSLVIVTPAGRTMSAIWGMEDVPALYREAVGAIAAAVAKALISGVFLPEQSEWGCPEAGGWQHFSISCPERLLFKPSVLRTTEQVMAEKKQAYEMLKAGLDEFSLKLAQKAYTLLTTGSLYRSEKCIEIAKWLVDVYKQRKSAKKRRQENIVWLAAATAPPGFCHVRSTMIGTLLSDLKQDLPFVQVKSRFDAKLDPLKYQRAQRAPKAGNIARAEKIVEQLKSAGALVRRFATLEEVQAVWRPTAEEPSLGKKGVFSHLKAAFDPLPEDLATGPQVVMTWEKFAKTVLPTAKRVDYFVPPNKQSYMGMVTAKNREAPPILQWDCEENRNPFSWYFYVNGSLPERWNLKPRVFHPVTAVVLQPPMWNEINHFSHQGKKVFFLLEGAKDKSYRQGCGFYPSFLKNEYHEIRATLEAYAKTAVVEGKDEATACGLGLSAGGTWNNVFRVTSQDDLRVIYKLDRWD